jgi:hypothetical protein
MREKAGERVRCSSAVQGTLPQGAGGADTRLRARAVTGKPAGAPKGERRAPRCNGAGGSGSSSSSRFVSLTCRTSCICSIDASDGCSAADARFWIVYRGRFRRVHDPHSCGQQLQRSLATRGVTSKLSPTGASASSGKCCVEEPFLRPAGSNCRHLLTNPAGQAAATNANMLSSAAAGCSCGCLLPALAAATSQVGCFGAVRNFAGTDHCHVSENRGDITMG